jgi:uncharacterized membrane protein
MHDHKPIDGFRWRSHEITRVEGFSDAVFGFAVTLLIVSLEVPKTSTELLEAMRGFGAFVVTFVILASIWYRQFTFFRRYALEDRVTVVLNLVLMFTVLFFIYPLKFLFAALLTDVHMRHTVMTPHGLEQVMLPEHKPLIYAIFGAGFVAVFFVFILLYRHAYNQREALGLNEFEIYETRHSIRRLSMATLVGATYFGLAWIEKLPHRTAGERRVVVIAGVALLVVMAAVVAVLMRQWRERKRVRAEWEQRSATTTDPPPAHTPRP